MQKKFIILIIAAIACTVQASAQMPDELKSKLNSIISGRKAETGIAIIINGKDTITVNDGNRYPMMSVFKFHQALAVANFLEKSGKGLDHTIDIQKEDLKTDTYSPLRDRYPDGNIRMSVKELLEYTLQLSDNNACDILFKSIADTKETDTFIRSLGIKNFAISATEDDMHADLQKCYDNWSTPLDAAILLEKFLNEDIISQENSDFIYRTMTECATGKERLSRPLTEKGITIGHKTGSGDKNSKREIIGINDIGFIILPDGTRYTIAVFVKDSKESYAETEKIIGDISEAVYKYITGKKQTQHGSICNLKD